MAIKDSFFETTYQKLTQIRVERLQMCFLGTGYMREN